MGVDPFSVWAETAIASFLTSAGVAGATAAAAAPWVFQGLVVGGLVGVNYLLAPHAPGAQSIDPGQQKSTFTASEGPEVRAVGRVRVGGTKIFGNTTGVNRYRLVLHCKGLIDKYETYYVGGREVVLQSGGFVNSVPWVIDDTTSYLLLKSDLGTDDKTAWSLLLTDFPDQWTSAHRARGIAQTLALFISPGLSDAIFLQLYQNGTPDFEVVIRAESNVYDPRSGVSSWSENGVLNALHILRSYPEFADIGIFDQEFIASEANRADALTPRYDGVLTKHSRCWGFWSSDAARGDTMQQVLDSVGAIIVPRSNGTQLGIQLLDDNPTTEASLEAKHILDIQWNSGPQGVERPNICTVQYYSPERNYDMTQIDLSTVDWARIDSEVEASGEKPLDLKLPFCPDSGQAQRIARLKFALARADSGVLHSNYAGLKIWGCRFVNIEFPDDLGTFLCYIGVPRLNDDQGQIEIPFVIWPQLDPWNPDIHEAPPPAQIPDIPLGTPLTTPSRPTRLTKATYPAGTTTRLYYSMTDDPDAVFPEVCYRYFDSDGLPNVWQPMVVLHNSGDPWRAETPSDLTGLTIECRYRTYDIQNNSSTWSPVLRTTVETVNTVPTLSVSSAVAPVVTATAPEDPDVKVLSFTGPDAPADTPVTPGQVVSFTSTSSTGTWTVKTKTYDGYESATVSVTKS